MTRTDEILEKLREGASIKSVRQQFKSQSQLYEALRIYLPEIEEKIEETRRTLSPLDSQKTILEKQVGSLKAECDQVRDQKDGFQQDLVSVKEELKEKSSQLDSVKTQLEEVAKLGITLEIVARIHEMELESKDDLLERVKTAAEYNSTKEELATMTEDKTRTQEEVDQLRNKKKDLINDVQSQKNLLDEWKNKTATFQKAVKITMSFFAQGYDTKDLERLKDGLTLLGVKGNPNLSINRLVEGLENAKTLLNLKNTRAKSEKELEALNANASAVKGELRTYKETVLKILDEARTRAIKDIGDAKRDAASAISEVRVEGEKSLSHTVGIVEKEVSAANKMLTSNASTLSKSTEDMAKFLNQRMTEALDKFDGRIADTMQGFVAAFEKATKLIERASGYADLMKYGYCLFGVLKIPDTIKEVPLSLIAQLADRIHVYIEIHFGDESASPSEAAVSREHTLRRFWSCRLSALSLWLKEELEKRSIEKGKKIDGRWLDEPQGT